MPVLVDSEARVVHYRTSPDVESWICPQRNSPHRAHTPQTFSKPRNCAPATQPQQCLPRHQLLNIVGRVLCSERELAATQQNKAILWACRCFVLVLAACTCSHQSPGLGLPCLSKILNCGSEGSVSELACASRAQLTLSSISRIALLHLPSAWHEIFPQQRSESPRRTPHDEQISKYAALV